ncbi:hypothetical protein AB0E59_30435 [Lentzea sp. NPDC034063]|uniref:hypothetical protein n=1 Tax=unclassified Lentzea TaxID=2643253 RepID=UPI003401EB46
MPPRRPVREQRTSQISRLSPAALRAIAVIERTHLRPGQTAEALTGWARFVHGPARAITGYEPDDCPCPGCEWDDPVARRTALATVLRALPAKPARELRALVRPLDELYLARSLPVPEHAHIRALLNT